MITKAELENLMAQCYGTEHYYTTMIPKVYYTDGVKTFCDNAQAYWFLTDVIAYMPEYIHKNDFFSVKLIVDTDGNYTINIGDGNGTTYKQLEGLTDCPEGNWLFFIERDAEGWIILWHDEH